MQGEALIRKRETIRGQSTVIKLQEELHYMKDNQAADLHSSIVTSVETTFAKPSIATQ